MLIISNSNPFCKPLYLIVDCICRDCSFSNAFYACFGLNPSPKHNGLWAILAIIVCTDPNFKKKIPEIVDYPGTFGILFSTYYALGHTYFNIIYYLGWIV